jgi:uncharacterized ion transporter superfamily protein YfcC
MFTKKLPTPITILMYVTIVAAIGTWILPAGKYDTLIYTNNSFVIQTPNASIPLPFSQRTLDSLHILIPADKFKNGDIRKPVSIPGTYHRLPENHQGIINIIEAPVKGIYDTIDIILFILFLGGFMNIFYQTGAMEKGLIFLSHKMKGKEKWLIITLSFLFSFGGASYGMAEEAMVFYPVMVPLFLAAGYDLLIPVAVIFGGTQLGTLSSFSNPFSTIIASNAAGVNWTDGFYERIVMFIVSTAVTIWYFSRYGKKIKKNPQASFVHKIDGDVQSPYPTLAAAGKVHTTLERRTRLLLLFFLFTFLIMITGVIFFDWWLLEMSALFLVASVIVAAIIRMKERLFVDKFIKGAEGLLSVAFIVGVARGVTIILNEGYISDTILYYSSQVVSSMPPTLFIILLLVLYIIFTLFISSSSGMAVVTMPIIGSLAVVAGVPGREIVNAYLFGMGIMGFISPTNLILPSLALVNNVSYKAWLRFIYPLLIILFIICALFLIVGVQMG